MDKQALKNTTPIDFETALSQLETVVTRLEGGELSLEQALKDFEQGIKLAQVGQNALQEAEQRIKILLEKNDTAQLDDYQAC
ncbi:exodeoxyribonuclease VII small subunit [Seminibacterium arietis]|uniref:Exodeoxyribonuclease 7 small subunit n=1 Tax=Seminibacterium arietis TaxID=1173502 RepID=A0ABW3I7F2_9PAST